MSNNPLYSGEMAQHKKRKWTEENIIQLIQERVKKGLPINHGAVCKENPALRKAAQRKFGTWSKAIIAAGFDPKHVKHPQRKWTPEIIISMIKTRVAEGKPLNYAYVESECGYLAKAGQRAFGSWIAALEAAGVLPKKIEWTKDEIIYIIRELRTMHYFSKIEGFVSAIHREYGSIDKAFAAAGVSKLHYVKWTEVKVIQVIRELSHSGKAPTIRDIESSKHSGLISGAVRLFGSWNAAVKAAGLKPNSTARWTKEMVIQTIRELSHSGKAPTATEVASLKQSGLIRGAERLFGSWNAAVKAAGFKPNDVSKWTREMVIQTIRDLSHSGKAPTAIEVVRSKQSGLLKGAERLFGSWNAAVKAAGFRPNLPNIVKKWTEEMVVQEIRKLSHSEKAPTIKLAEAQTGLVKGAISVFGSWNAAVKAAGFKPNIPNIVKKWTEEMVIQEIRKLPHSEKAPTMKLAKAQTGLVKGAVSVFGSWNAAVKAAGFKPNIPNNVKKWTEEMVIQEVRKLPHSEKAPTMKLAKAQTGLVRGAVSLFGSWNAAVEAAGLIPNNKRLARFND